MSLTDADLEDLIDEVFADIDEHAELVDERLPDCTQPEGTPPPIKTISVSVPNQLPPITPAIARGQMRAGQSQAIAANPYTATPG